MNQAALIVSEQNSSRTDHGRLVDSRFIWVGQLRRGLFLGKKRQKGVTIEREEKQEQRIVEIDSYWIGFTSKRIFLITGDKFCVN